jgi:hypothetical protein
MASVQRSDEKPETRYVDDHHSYRPGDSIRIEGDKPWWAFGFRHPRVERFVSGERATARRFRLDPSLIIEVAEGKNALKNV